MEDFWKVICERRSVRSFKPDSIPDELIEKCICAAHIAPSAGNQKNWRFIVVKSREKIDGLKNVIEEKIEVLRNAIKSPKAREKFEKYSWRYFTFFSEAPAVICVVLKPYDSLSVRIIKRIDPSIDYSSSAGIQSVAAAVENLILAATSYGLGTCWMTGPLIAREELEKFLNIEKPDALFALVPVGYPSEEVEPHKITESIDKISMWI